MTQGETIAHIREMTERRVEFHMDQAAKLNRSAKYLRAVERDWQLTPAEQRAKDSA